MERLEVYTSITSNKKLTLLWIFFILSICFYEHFINPRCLKENGMKNIRYITIACLITANLAFTMQDIDAQKKAQLFNTLKDDVSRLERSITVIHQGSRPDLGVHHQNFTTDAQMEHHPVNYFDCYCRIPGMFGFDDAVMVSTALLMLKHDAQRNPQLLNYQSLMKNLQKKLLNIGAIDKESGATNFQNMIFKSTQENTASETLACEVVNKYMQYRETEINAPMIDQYNRNINSNL